MSALAVALLTLTPSRPGMSFQFDTSVYDGVKPSIIRISCSNRAATGFLWSNSDTAVTALHVVAGCDKIAAYYEALKITRPAKVVRVLRHADLVLLKISDAPNAPVLVADPKPPSLTDQLSTLGYPLQLPSMSSTTLQLRYGGKTLRNIVPESVAQALSGGSPSLDLEIDSIEGHLLPGHSGAPIFNEQRKIVAIADGGLENGAAALSWGIPAHFLNQLAASDERPETAATASGTNHTMLFSAENEARNLGEITCSGITLTKLRTTNFAHLYKSVDDPASMLQMVQSMGTDPSNFTFDVYQHLLSGATFVIPSGAELRSSGTGDCTAMLPSGQVELRVQVGVLGSPYAAISKSQEFERSLVNGNTRGWTPDPEWTKVAPLTRFDGLVVRRQGYAHMKLFPLSQDKYLFEVVATRSSVFIGAAALRGTLAQLTPKTIKACKEMPTGPGCEDLRQYAVDWLKAMLGIQLTTFPVG